MLEQQNNDIRVFLKNISVAHYLVSGLRFQSFDYLRQLGDEFPYFDCLD